MSPHMHVLLFVSVFLRRDDGALAAFLWARSFVECVCALEENKARNQVFVVIGVDGGGGDFLDMASSPDLLHPKAFGHLPPKSRVIPLARTKNKKKTVVRGYTGRQIYSERFFGHVFREQKKYLIPRFFSSAFFRVRVCIPVFCADFFFSVSGSGRRR